MKVLCDVCEKTPASVMCCADEAALCLDCDARVHAANKLARKHQRIPLVFPAPEEAPSCDICQEKTGYFFCMEDRALLCRNCDFSIHSKTTLAAQHKRFLVTGIRVALQSVTGQDRTEKNPQTCSPTQSVSSACQTLSHHRASSRIVHHQPSAETVDDLKDLTSSQTLLHHTSMQTQQSIVLGHTDAPSPVMTHRTSPQTFSYQASGSAIPHQVPPVTPTAREQANLHNRKLIPPDEDAASGNGTQLPFKRTSKSVVPSISALVSPAPLAPPPIPPPSSQHVLPNTERMFSNWEMGPNILDGHSQSIVHVPAKGGISTSGGGGGFVRSNRVSDYLMETIPGWKVDELLGFPDSASYYSFADSGTSKADVSSFGDMEWPADCALDEQMLGESFGQVPSVPSPPTASGVPRAGGKSWGYGKNLKQVDLVSLLAAAGGCEDTLLVVPETGGVFSRPSLSSMSPPCKRRRSSLENY